ncbi:MAG: hypothetical protein ACI8QS_000648 [Planctomycetota bacterium]|jgi:hypothetical protein
MSSAESQTYHWSEAESFLYGLQERGFTLEPGGRFFEGEGLRCTPPLVLPIAEGCRSIDDYLCDLPEKLPRHLVILMQAGATSLAVFDDEEPLATKSFKRYVVRGKGHSQATHLASKGKSRYGSRLRLQNAKRLIEETVEKLVEWEEEFGEAKTIYYSAPVRLWPSMFEASITPPFPKDGPLVKIPRDIPRPTTDVLMRIYRGLCYGRLEVAN